MGSLGGHLLPGSFFIIFAIWWGFITSLRYVQTRVAANASRKTAHNRNKKPLANDAAANDDATYQTSVWMPCICLPCGPRARRAPIECWLKAVLAFIALVIEAYTAVSFQVTLSFAFSQIFQ